MTDIRNRLARSAPTQDSGEYAEAYEAMLAVLKDIQRDASRGAGVSLRQIEQMKAAIAKAEGRS